MGHGESQLLLRHRTAPGQTLVAQRPDTVQRGSYLTDGKDLYEVLDRAENSAGGRRPGTWLLIQNVKFEGNAQWFRIEDAAPLLIVKRHRRQDTVIAAGKGARS